jgi:hypothetical protein
MSAVNLFILKHGMSMFLEKYKYGPEPTKLFPYGMLAVLEKCLPNMKYIVGPPRQYRSSTTGEHFSPTTRGMQSSSFQ